MSEKLEDDRFKVLSDKVKYINELEFKTNVINEFSGLNYTKNNINGSLNNCTNKNFNYLDNVSKAIGKESIFLQEELRNKNAVIQVLLENNKNLEHKLSLLIPSTDTERITKMIDKQENPFIKPKHTIKKTSRKDSDVNNVLLTQNRYSSLWEENIDKNTDESDDVPQVHTENINDEDVIKVNTKEAVKSKSEANKEVLQNQSQLLTISQTPKLEARKKQYSDP